MNCKPGDLAHIRNSNIPLLVGRLVEVLPEPSVYGPGWWRVRFVGRAGLIDLGGTLHGSREGNIQDHRLRPIRDPGDDAVDEVLQRIPSPFTTQPERTEA